MGCDIHAYVETRQQDGSWKKADIDVPDDRNYVAFAKLANVRNGSGFAGTDTGDEIAPIDQPRGIPNDTSIIDNNLDCENPESVWLGDHSHSWVLLSELLAVNYNEPVIRRGMVSPEIYEHCKKWGARPREWCSCTNRDDYIKYEWTEKLYEAAHILPQMIAAVCHLGKPENVRIVYGFDS